jgi:hypothetical protein
MVSKPVKLTPNVSEIILCAFSLALTLYYDPFYVYYKGVLNTNIKIKQTKALIGGKPMNRDQCISQTFMSWHFVRL